MYHLLAEYKSYWSFCPTHVFYHRKLCPFGPYAGTASHDSTVIRDFLFECQQRMGFPCQKDERLQQLTSLSSSWPFREMSSSPVLFVMLSLQVCQPFLLFVMSCRSGVESLLLPSQMPLEIHFLPQMGMQNGNAEWVHNGPQRRTPSATCVTRCML